MIFYAKKILRLPNAVYIRRGSEGSVMRKNRTPPQIVNFWVSPILLGLKTLDNFMSHHEFFKRNPQYRHAVLNMFLQWKFNAFFQASQYLSPAAFYETVKQEYGDRFGEYDVLISALCTALNTQQKITHDTQQKYQQLAAQAQEQIQKFNQFAAAAQAQVQKFNQFAAAAQARIAELEAEVKRLQN